MEKSNICENLSDVLMTSRIEEWAWEELSDSAPGSTSYGKAIRLKYPLKAKKLEKAIQQVINENDAYRMVFNEKEGKLYATVLPECEFHLPVINVPGKTKEEKMAFVTKDCESRIDSKYDIANCCYQFVLYKLGMMDYVLLAAMTHLITDGNAFALTFFNIIGYYLRDKPMFAPKGSFVDYIEDEKKFLLSETCNKQKAHWDEVMKGYKSTPAAVLGTQAYDKEKSGVYFDVPKSNIPLMATKYESNVFSFLLAAFHLALYSINGTPDSLIKYADANRNEKYKFTLGFLSLFVPNRAVMDKNMKVSELIAIITESSRRDYVYKRTGSLYSDTCNIYSYITTSKEVEDDGSLKTGPVNSSMIELLNFKNGRDSKLLILVINDMPDSYAMELTGSSRIYGQDYIESFYKEFLRIVDVLKTGEDMLIRDILGLEDEIEEI